MKTSMKTILITLLVATIGALTVAVAYKQNQDFSSWIDSVFDISDSSSNSGSSEHPDPGSSSEHPDDGQIIAALDMEGVIKKTDGTVETVPQAGIPGFNTGLSWYQYGFGLIVDEPMYPAITIVGDIIPHGLDGDWFGILFSAIGSDDAKIAVSDIDLDGLSVNFVPDVEYANAGYDIRGDLSKMNVDGNNYLVLRPYRTDSVALPEAAYGRLQIVDSKSNLIESIDLGADASEE